jgi:hypothetical protein
MNRHGLLVLALALWAPRSLAAQARPAAPAAAPAAGRPAAGAQAARPASPQLPDTAGPVE